MTPARPKKNTTVVAAFAVAAASAVQQHVENMSAVCTAVSLVAEMETKRASQYSNIRRKKQGRYRRKILHPTSKSFWARLYSMGDNLEFLHFKSLNRCSFEELVLLVTPVIESTSLDPRNADNILRKSDLRQRLFSPKDILAMTLKYLTTKAELKELHVFFGATATPYKNCI